MYDWWSSLKLIREQLHWGIWWWFLFSIRLFCFLDILSCLSDPNLEISPLICWEWKPNILDTERIDNSYWMMPMNAEWSLRGDMPSSFDDSVEVDGRKTWYQSCSKFSGSVEAGVLTNRDRPFSVFTWDHGGVEGNQTSLLKPYWISHEHSHG